MRVEAFLSLPSWRLWRYVPLRIFDEFFFDFSPSRRTVRVSHSDNAVNRFVDFPPVLSSDLYSCSLEELFQMPEIACQDSQLENAARQGKAFEALGFSGSELGMCNGSC